MLSVAADKRIARSWAPGGARSPHGRGLRALAAVLRLGGHEAPIPFSSEEAAQPALSPSAAHGRLPLGPETHAFDLFFAEHEQPLYGYLRRMVSSDEVALELAQESFFRAWQHFDEVSAYDRPGAWLFRIATNLAISHLRRRRAAPFTVLAAEHGGGDSLAEECFADPSDFASDSAERDAIGRVLRQLPERQRAALLLRAVHGLSCDEIAQALGLSAVGARKLLSRGRERFRTLYLGHPPETAHPTDVDARIQGGQR